MEPGVLMLDGIYLTQEEKDHGPGISRADSEVFKLGLRGRGIIGFCHFWCVCVSLVVPLWMFKGNASETSTIKTRKTS